MTLLPMNGDDQPSCPKCGHYNAMITDTKYLQLRQVCRDCGFTITENSEEIVDAD
jgi:ribosomal protein S27AE